MSLKDYNAAISLMKQNDQLCDFVGNCSEELIKNAEKKLNIQFPQTYRDFLLTYGAGNFGSEEIYGVIKNDFDNSGIPDAIWFTHKQRKEAALPVNLLVIYHTGGEEMFCIDFNQVGAFNEPIVVSYLIGLDKKDQTFEKIANDFGEFLLQRVKIQLGIY